MTSPAPSYWAFPVDPEEVAETASDLLDDGVDAGNAIIILAQQDPLEICTEGTPRWLPDHQSLILRAQEQVRMWENQ